jgi:hypothetical protein
MQFAEWKLAIAPFSTRIFHIDESHFRDRNVNSIIIYHFLCLHPLYNQTPNPVDYYWEMASSPISCCFLQGLPVSTLVFSSLP